MNSERTDNILNKSMDDAAKNKIKEIIAYSARVIALTFASGAMMQTFLASLGFETKLIYLHTTFLQAANVLTIVLFSRWAEIGNPIKRAAFTSIPMALLFLIYVPIAISKSSSLTTYVLLILTGVAQQVALGLYTVCQYKIPYFIYHADEYGKMLSICGIVSSSLSLGVSSLISFFTLRFRFVDIAFVIFIACALLMLTVFVSTFIQKSLVPIETPSEDKERTKTSLISLLKIPLFYRLLPSNVLRGFTAGVIVVLATVALDIGFGETLTTSMVTVSFAASLLSSALYAALSKKIQPRFHLLSGSAVMMLLPLMMIKSAPLFLIIYAFITVGKTLVDYSVPSILLKNVPVEIAGSYHAWRMVLQNLGTLFASFIAAYIPIPLLLTIAAVSQVICGISYDIVTNQNKNHIS